MAGDEGLDLRSTGADLRGYRHSRTGSLSCGMPLACLTPITP